MFWWVPFFVVCLFFKHPVYVCIYTIYIYIYVLHIHMYIYIIIYVTATVRRWWLPVSGVWGSWHVHNTKTTQVTGDSSVWSGNILKFVPIKMAASFCLTTLPCFSDSLWLSVYILTYCAYGNMFNFHRRPTMF